MVPQFEVLREEKNESAPCYGFVPVVYSEMIKCSCNVSFQVHGARLPLRPILVALYILLWRRHNGKHWQATSHGRYRVNYAGQVAFSQHQPLDKRCLYGLIEGCYAR